MVRGVDARASGVGGCDQCQTIRMTSCFEALFSIDEKVCSWRRRRQAFRGSRTNVSSLSFSQTNAPILLRTDRLNQGSRAAKEGNEFDTRTAGDEPHFATMPFGSCRRSWDQCTLVGCQSGGVAAKIPCKNRSIDRLVRLTERYECKSVARESRCALRLRSRGPEVEDVDRC
jgi:hypothetical protein